MRVRLACLVCLPALGSLHAQRYANPRGWSVEVGKAWEVIDQSKAQELKRGLKEGEPGGGSKFNKHVRTVMLQVGREVEAGQLVLFIPAAAESHSQFVAIRTVSGFAPSPVEIKDPEWTKRVEKELRSGLAPTGTGIKAEVRSSEMLQVGGQDATLHKMRFTSAGNPALVNLYCFIPGGDRLFRLEAGSEEKYAPKMEKRVRSLLSSFAGAKPGDGLPRRGFWDGIAGKALIGGLCGLGVAAFLHVLKSRRTRPQPLIEGDDDR